MNNIYVDELPDCCGNCSLCCKDDLGYWCQAKTLIYVDERFVAEKRLKSCPLKTLRDIEVKYNNGQILHSEFSALENKIREEERKRVVQEIKQRFCRVEDTLINLGNGKEDALNYFVKVLDQIERGEI